MAPSLFPDVNVWLALTHERHVHHPLAARWFESVEGATLYFCRFTQIGLLRLLTSQTVMADEVMQQRQAWRVYHRWFDDSRVAFQAEPESSDFESWFEKFSEAPAPSTKRWADAYLAAFAKTCGFTLVTFDKGFVKSRDLKIRFLATDAG
jgi:uncharacterized protein